MKAMSPSAAAIGTLMAYGLAHADVVWDYTVASCANGGNNNCPVVGQTLATLTLQGPSEVGQYTYKTGFHDGSVNTGTGTLDFTLQMEFATLSPAMNYCANSSQCLWTVAFDEQLPNPTLGQYAFSFRDGAEDAIVLSPDGSGRLSPNLDWGALGVSCGIPDAGCVIEGKWAEVSSSTPAPDPVPEPSSWMFQLMSFMMWATVPLFMLGRHR